MLHTSTLEQYDFMRDPNNELSQAVSGLKFKESHKIRVKKAKARCPNEKMIYFQPNFNL